MRYAFQTLKDHAKQRGIRFTLSFTLFRSFALQSDYLNRKGNGKKCLTVDRIKNTRGYVRGNIQALTRERNRDKQAKVDMIRRREGMKWKDNL